MSLKEQDGSPSGVTPLDIAVAIWGDTSTGYGVFGSSSMSAGVRGESSNGNGVEGGSQEKRGVLGESVIGTGVQGISDEGGIGVQGISDTGIGVSAESVDGIALAVNGTIQVQGDAVGQITLTAGGSSVVVNNPAATTTSTILLTPLGNPGGQLWVMRAAGGFTIQSSGPVANDLDITYLIIN